MQGVEYIELGGLHLIQNVDDLFSVMVFFQELGEVVILVES